MNLTGIAVLPNDEFRDALIEFQARHRSVIAGPVLGRDCNIPHVSILQCPYTDELPNAHVLTELATVATKYHELPLDVQHVRYQPAGWLFLGVARTGWLEAVHDYALRITEPYIDRHAIDAAKDTIAYSELERINYARYGYRYVGSAFQPHFTLGRVSEADHVPTELDRAFNAYTDETMIAAPRAERLVVYRAGQHGALTEVLDQVSVRDAEPGLARPDEKPS